MRRTGIGRLGRRDASSNVPRSLRLCALCLALLMLLVAACTSATKVPPKPTATATPPPTPSPTATATLVPGPRPVSQPLGAPPSSCPASPQPQTMSFPNGFGSYGNGVRFFGKDIVWIPEPSYPMVAHLEPHGYTQWPALAIVWEVGPDAMDAVSVQVTNAQTGTILWWIHDAPPDLSSQTLVLDADTPGPAMYNGVPEKSWQEFKSSLLIPQAGCYEMNATWDGGSWQMVFAAGA